METPTVQLVCGCSKLPNLGDSFYNVGSEFERAAWKMSIANWPHYSPLLDDLGDCDINFESLSLRPPEPTQRSWTHGMDLSGATNKRLPSTCLPAASALNRETDDGTVPEFPGNRTSGRSVSSQVTGPSTSNSATSSTAAPSFFPSFLSSGHHSKIANGRRYPCKMCAQVFDNKTDHQMHLQHHAREAKPYRCLQCPKMFANNSYLSQHMRIHLGIKPHRCDICKKNFTQLSHLQQHLRTHTGDKPYKCPHYGCLKAFSQLSNLQSHSRVHQTDKPYRCNSCYRCFVDKQSLQEHIPKHKESKHLKTHICNFCGKSYTQGTYLTKHLSKHADESIHQRVRNHVDNSWMRMDNSYDTGRSYSQSSAQENVFGASHTYSPYSSFGGYQSFSTQSNPFGFFVPEQTSQQCNRLGRYETHQYLFGNRNAATENLSGHSYRA